MVRGVSYRGAMRLPSLALIALLVACATDPVIAPRDCTPGTTSPCACPGASGVQTCTAEGRVGACMCPDGGGGGVDVAVTDVPAVDVVSPEDHPASMDTAAVVDAVPADVVDGAAADVVVACDGTCPALVRATTACLGGACSIVACSAGFANCDGEFSNGCETNFTTNSMHCGRCGSACDAGQACVLGRCAAECPMGRSRCRETVTFDGICVDLQSDPNNCGRCSNACVFPHAAPACLRGQCVIGACAPGYCNLDRDQTNGCESAVRGDAGC